MPSRRRTRLGRHITLNCAHQTAAALRRVAKGTRNPLSSIVAGGFADYLEGRLTDDIPPPAGDLVSIGVYIDPDLARAVRTRLAERDRTMPWLLHQIALSHEPTLATSQDALAMAIRRAPAVARLLPPENSEVLDILWTAMSTSGEAIGTVVQQAELGLARLAELVGDPESVPVAARALVACLLAPANRVPGIEITPPTDAEVVKEAAHVLLLAFPLWQIKNLSLLAVFLPVLLRFPARRLRYLSGADLGPFKHAVESALGVLRGLERTIKEPVASTAAPAVMRDRQAIADAFTDVLCEALRRTAPGVSQE